MKLPINSKSKAKLAPAFTLIVTLSLMVLLSILCVSMLSLSTITLRSARSVQYAAEARANAKMALMLAIGELQKELGPDQRISARAEILDSNTATPDVDGVSHPQWIGAWDSWKTWLNDENIKATYDRGRTSQFRKWLVSHPDPSSLDEITSVQVATADESIKMVETDGTFVQAPLVGVNSQGNGNKGKFAWWISGENQKAHVALPANPPSDNTDMLHARSHFPQPRADSLDGLEGAPHSSEELVRVASLSTLALTDSAKGAGGTQAFSMELKRRFHDLTVHSKGLLSNVRHGGLKKDLNLLLELPTLPSQYGTLSRANPSGTIVPMRSNTETLPTPVYAQNNNFSSWYKLHQYYQLYRGGGEETALDCRPLALQKGVWGSASKPQVNYQWDARPWVPNITSGNLDVLSIGRTPIIARIMLIFFTRLEKTADGKYNYKIGISPSVTLWNPYNVTLQSPQLTASLKLSGIAYKAFDKNGAPVPLNPNYQDWMYFYRQLTPEIPATATSSKVNATYDTSPMGFTMNIKPASGAPANAPIVLLPGETRVFSPPLAASNSINFDLAPGFDPAIMGGYEEDIGHLKGRNDGKDLTMSLRYEGPSIYWTMANLASTGDRFSEVEAYPVNGGPIYLAEDAAGKRAQFADISESAGSSLGPRNYFSNFQFVLKSGQDLRNPGLLYAPDDFRCKNFIHANPVNQRAWYGKPTPRMRGMSQFHVHVHPNGAGNGLIPDVGANNRGYLGSAISTNGSKWLGQPSLVTNEIPLIPITSVASLMHHKLNPGDSRNPGTGRHLFEVSANQALAIGNSFAHPLISGDSIYEDVADAETANVALIAGNSHLLARALIRDFHDHGYLNNDALWDDWFCSGITQEDQGLFQSGRSIKNVIDDLWSGEGKSQNPHLVVRKSKAGATQDNELMSGSVPSDTAHQIAARDLILEGAFNINSTSVDAWKSMLSGLKDKELLHISPETGEVSTSKVPDDVVLISRFSLPASDQEGENAGSPASWLGVRYLTAAQIDRLAKECVRQVKERGPFLNLSDFINRRLSNDAKGVNGALQAAIDWDDSSPANSADSINGRFKLGDDFIQEANFAGWNLEFPDAAKGSRFTGIPGYVTQADLLKRIGNMITPRDDSFCIRAYGESRDQNGNLMAKSWCEAVLCRAPEYMDPTDKAETATAAISPFNQRFGRRFEMTRFRWLNENEL